MNLRQKVYRTLQRRVLERLVLGRAFSASRRAATFSPDRVCGNPLLRNSFGQKGLIWFHAASAGELESLTSVIQRWVGDGGDAVVSAFSESAASHLKKLENSLQGSAGKLWFCGYAPWEGRWGEALDWAQPVALVTAKYEAWPDLWMSLAERHVPLVIVGAKDRKSLRSCRNLCRSLGAPLPRFVFFTVDEVDVAPLRQAFPEATVEIAGDPRWDQIHARSQKGNFRARALLERFQHLPRPWTVLAQVWAEDLKFCSSSLSRIEGTLWVVPHRVEAAHVAPLVGALSEQGLDPVKTSMLTVQNDRGASSRCIFVDEMGFLLELYQGADRAYVGGGFGAGIHNTMEPAIYGMPVACGPGGVEKFPETRTLRSTGQLTVLTDPSDWDRWLSSFSEQLTQRPRWQQEAQARLGATDKIRNALTEIGLPG